MVGLATFSDFGRRAEKHRTKQKIVNREAEAGPFVSTALAGIEAENHVSYHTHVSGHEIVGLVLLSPGLAQHQALLPLDDDDAFATQFVEFVEWGQLGWPAFLFQSGKS